MSLQSDDPKLYSKAVQCLAESDGPWIVSEVLRCLLLRDALARQVEDGQLVDGQQAEEVIAADATLSELGPRLAELEVLGAWHKRFSPPSSAWWWYPEVPRPWCQRLEGLWNLLTLVALALIVSLASDLVRRFDVNGLGERGMFFVVFPTLLAGLSAGSVLFRGLKACLEDAFALVPFLDKRRSLATLVLTLAFCSLVAATWQSLPTFSRDYNDRGAVALRDGRLAEAKAALKRAVQLDPSNALAHYNLGSVYEDLVRKDLAKTHYRIAFAAGQVRASNNLGRLFLLEGEPEQAVSLLTGAWDAVQQRGDAIRIETRYDILKNLGWARLEQGRFNEARDRLGAAVKLLPDAAEAHCLMGRLYTAQEQMVQARREWEACLRADPRVREQDRWLGEAKAFLSRHDAGAKE